METKPDIAFMSITVAFDMFVFVSTLFYAFRASQSSSPRNLLQAILRDGVIYFFYIFSQNLLLILFIIYARVSSYTLCCAYRLTCIFLASTKGFANSVSRLSDFFPLVCSHTCVLH